VIELSDYLMNFFQTFPDSLKMAEKALKKGDLILIDDDESRENEVDFVGCAKSLSLDSLNFILSHGRGLLCVALSSERAHHLGFPSLPRYPFFESHTNFSYLVDSIHVKTGISAPERLQTIQSLACAPDATAFQYPGHIPTLIAHPNLIRARTGHTESSLSLGRFCGLSDAMVICEILDKNGLTVTGQQARQEPQVIEDVLLSQYLQSGVFVSTFEIWLWDLFSGQETFEQKGNFMGLDWALQPFTQNQDAFNLRLGSWCLQLPVERSVEFSLLDLKSFFADQDLCSLKINSVKRLLLLLKIQKILYSGQSSELPDSNDLVLEGLTSFETRILEIFRKGMTYGHQAEKS
jgi:3,4-dihydroxy-2-butanone 4-phosphate synthase